MRLTTKLTLQEKRAAHRLKLNDVHLAEVAEFYNEQLLRQGVKSKVEPDSTV